MTIMSSTPPNYARSMGEAKRLALAKALLINLQAHVGPAFHPDTPLADYWRPNEDGSETQLFNTDDLPMLQAGLNQAFETFEDVGEDVYAFCASSDTYRTQMADLCIGINPNGGTEFC